MSVVSLEYAIQFTNAGTYLATCHNKEGQTEEAAIVARVEPVPRGRENVSHNSG